MLCFWKQLYVDGSVGMLSIREAVPDCQGWPIYAASRGVGSLDPPTGVKPQPRLLLHFDKSSQFLPPTPSPFLVSQTVRFSGFPRTGDCSSLTLPWLFFPRTEIGRSILRWTVPAFLKIVLCGILSLKTSCNQCSWCLAAISAHHLSPCCFFGYSLGLRLLVPGLLASLRLPFPTVVSRAWRVLRDSSTELLIPTPRPGERPRNSFTQCSLFVVSPNPPSLPVPNVESHENSQQVPLFTESHARKRDPCQTRRNQQNPYPVWYGHMYIFIFHVYVIHMPIFI